LEAQNNQQQQLVNQGTLRHDTASHHQASKLYQTSNLQTPKTTPSSSISLVPTKTNGLYDIAKLSNDYSQTKALGQQQIENQVGENNHYSHC
jgi:hypothetical protein